MNDACSPNDDLHTKYVESLTVCVYFPFHKRHEEIQSHAVELATKHEFWYYKHTCTTSVACPADIADEFAEAVALKCGFDFDYEIKTYKKAMANELINLVEPLECETDPDHTLSMEQT